MISRLFIENLILIPKIEMHFGPHLNILTGETGSGKSVILTALRLIAAERFDLDMIGKWGEKTIIEAKVKDHLIRREMSRGGKGRCWIDEELVSLSFLKQFIGSSIEIVDQNTSQTLHSKEIQRKKLDLFASLNATVAQFSDSFHEQMHLKQKLFDLQKQMQEQKQNIALAETNLKLIQEVDWKQGEEETLSEEHTRLTHFQEIFSSIQTIAANLAENSFVKQIAYQLQGCTRFDAKLEPIAVTLKNASLELEEVEQKLRSYLDRLEIDPARVEKLETRIAAIEPIKKRFGPTWEEVEKKKKLFQSQLDSQSDFVNEMQLLSKTLQQLEEKNLLLAEVLSAKRKKAALHFEKAVVEELRLLNLAEATFQVQIEPQSMAAYGTDNVQYLFSANRGTPPSPLENCASGGEMSRLLFAIQSVLAQKENSGCLVLDEIDSNVGGYTASIFGKKLQELAQYRQVISITHFAQVAQFATDHFSVSKQESSITVQYLNERDRKNEYLRMQGHLK